ncbi:MAG: ATP-binding protein [Caldilineaceae bacterium]
MDKLQTLAQGDQVHLGKAPFSVMARVAMQLGRESISNSIVAITELVKNAYDADAEHVSIHFAGLDTENPILVIEDDGNGMTRKQLEERWLVIGTPNKLSSGHSARKGRILTGEKGLGRLGLDRLCTQTIVQTFVESANLATKLVIDWTKYEKNDGRLEEIEHDIFAIPKSVTDYITDSVRHITKGTQLILFGLKDEWTHDSLIRLREELALLVSPFGVTGNFSIALNSGITAWNSVNGEIASNIMLEVAEWNLRAEIATDHSVSFHMWSNRYVENFELEPITWKEAFTDSRYDVPECGPLTFEMYFFPRREINLEDLQISRTQIETFLNANQGIRIYRDNFRVKPFGAPDGSGDWLNLSYRRQQSPQGVTQKPLGGWKVGYNQVVGAVFISRIVNSALIDQTNRENLVEGPAFYDLRKFAIKAIEFFELNRQKFEIKKKEDEKNDIEKAKDQVERSSKATEDTVTQAKNIVADIVQQTEKGRAPETSLINTLSDKLTQIEDQLQEQRKARQELEKQTEEQQALLQRQKDTLGNLASLGILATSFGHETLGASNLVLSNALDLQQDMITGLFMVDPNIREEIEEELEIIVHEADKVETFAKFMLRNVRRDKRHRQAINLNHVIERVFSSLSRFLAEKKINLQLDLSNSLPSILAFEIDWESIFVNLITNAVWALEARATEYRVIRVKAFENQDNIHIKFADSGIGIESGTKEQIFLPTISTKRNSVGEVIGTGMGLAIVKDFVESHERGAISVESPCDLGGTQFHIQLAVPNLQGRGAKSNG